jgi:uncharacterized membrane protein YbjE (DUF340 family)
MSRAPTQIGAKRSIMRTLSEMYLSIFVLFFRITLWEGRMKSYTASILASMVPLFIAFTFWMSIELATGHELDLNRWVLVPIAAIFAIYGPSWERRGIEFEKHFCGFSRNKRIALQLAAAGIVVVTLISFFMVGTEYRSMFHPPGN